MWIIARYVAHARAAILDDRKPLTMTEVENRIFGAATSSSGIRGKPKIE